MQQCFVLNISRIYSHGYLTNLYILTDRYRFEKKIHGAFSDVCKSNSVIAPFLKHLLLSMNTTPDEIIWIFWKMSTDD